MRGGTSVRPTAFGLTIVVVAAAVLAGSSSINDPALAGLIWAVVAALVVVGIVWPLLAIRFVRITAVEAPHDAVVGRRSALGVAVDLPGLLDTISLRVRNTAGEPEWWSLGAGRSWIEAPPARRGVYPAIGVEVATDGPLGAVVVSRRLDLPLERAVRVGPDAPFRRWSPPTSAESGTDARRTGSALGGDIVRSVRPYRTGDPAHLVHWPSSARLGDLVVRELEPPERPGIVLVVRVSADGDPDEVEQAVADAAGVAESVLRDGGGVLLCTCDLGVATAAEVTTPLQVRRRLAGAVPGPVGAAPASGWAVHVVEAGGGASGETSS